MLSDFGLNIARKQRLSNLPLKLVGSRELVFQQIERTAGSLKVLLLSGELRLFAKSVLVVVFFK